ncbi:MAG: SPOR domain-containing protein [Candidatus Glassbacteria bacterium]
MRLLIFTRKADNPKIIRLSRTAAVFLELAFLLTFLLLLALASYLYRETRRLTGETVAAGRRESELRSGIVRADSLIAELQRQTEAASPVAGSSSGDLPSAAVDSVRYTVQVASHRDSADAAAAARLLGGLVRQAVEVTPTRLPNGLWYRVQAGSFASEEAARAWADSLLRAGLLREYNVRRLEPENSSKN